MIDDDQLMVKIQEGDPAAFEELVERHQGPLINFFYTNSRDRQLAEDLTQETLLRVYDQGWDYLPRGKFRGWMFRIARNLLIDTVRRRSHDALVKAVHSRNDEQSLITGIVADVISPEEAANHRELAGMVDHLLIELPEEQRLTFTLHHFAGLPLGEIAEILESTVPTTKSRLRLAREKLRDQLRARGIEPITPPPTG